LFAQALSFEPCLPFLGEDSGGDEVPESEDAAEVEAAGRQMAAGPTGLSSEQKRKVNMVHVNLGHISRQQMLSLSLSLALSSKLLVPMTKTCVLCVTSTSATTV